VAIANPFFCQDFPISPPSKAEQRMLVRLTHFR
jgi:hypothetical protein